MRRNFSVAKYAAAASRLVGSMAICSLLAGSPARAQAQTLQETHELAQAEIRWQQRRANLTTLQWQPRVPWERQPDVGDRGQRRPLLDRRPPLRPYWYDRWARRWPYPGASDLGEKSYGRRASQTLYGSNSDRAVIDRRYGWRVPHGGIAATPRGRPWDYDRYGRYDRRAPW